MQRVCSSLGAINVFYLKYVSTFICVCVLFTEEILLCRLAEQIFFPSVQSDTSLSVLLNNIQSDKKHQR